MLRSAQQLARFPAPSKPAAVARVVNEPSQSAREANLRAWCDRNGIRYAPAPRWPVSDARLREQA